METVHGMCFCVHSLPKKINSLFQLSTRLFITQHRETNVNRFFVSKEFNKQTNRQINEDINTFHFKWVVFISLYSPSQQSEFHMNVVPRSTGTQIMEHRINSEV